MKNDNKEIVLLSTADWDNPFWTNKQHVAVEFARRGYKVLYIDSLGLRKPSLNKKDFSRILKKLFKALRPPKKVQENIWVWSPITLPWNEYRAVRSFNKFYLSFFVKMWSKLLGFRNPWLWTYNPLTTEFLNPNDFSKTIYHCVDEIKAQPGMPIDVLEREEKTLIQQASIIFVTALQLKENRVKWNDNIHYFSNVADYVHFNTAVTKDYVIPEDLKNISSPVLGFIGAVSSYKINLDLISYLAAQRPQYSIVIIGEVGEGDPSTKIDILRAHKNIHLLGPKPYNVLPQYLKYFDVALLPNNLNEYTDNMFPMKFFEYLAAGKPIVSVDLSSIQEFHNVVKIGKDKFEFVMAVDAVISGDVVPLNERLALAKEYTYETRTDKMLKMLI
ncbi:MULTISPECIES: glycosyltransferase [Rahnella]|jgi:glycosyltransferase involved in cell wall biosynthesis|uniref:Glycosyltransferase n=1 Tax=Rahnella sp. (strain Y9602) TaxID=2703885 RepID=A0ABW6C9B6_RAHSY|nr:glycosyltransferase [Rahnella aceris]MDP9703390.1 glycosyltransferase involved in cell wall biosynthesis [Rahnella aquatilis]NIA89108.1 glycosyltransferase family 1 protein [Rahnella aceris]